MFIFVEIFFEDLLLHEKSITINSPGQWWHQLHVTNMLDISVL